MMLQVPMLSHGIESRNQIPPHNSSLFVCLEGCTLYPVAHHSIAAYRLYKSWRCVRVVTLRPRCHIRYVKKDHKAKSDD